MDEDLVIAMKRIITVTRYALDERESRDEMGKTLAYIIEEATEALNNAKALHALLEEQDQ